ncbi:dual specificity protein phosphatase 12 [Phtheirospermum japonicum]|uniref:protein-tyrosine-phosphatase n=1 Tax=Phtheirospermum japonicum TaxID=374723 RepID=A0A830C8E6_9LAMI|nr:dual specificity protein phosphatase 12 [Phtheirospermum japonicum]
MPHLVREHLLIGNIGDAAEILQNGSDDITHILSVLSSASISFFSEWRSGLSIPTKEIRKVYVGDSGSKSSLSPDKLLYSLEHAGKDLKFVRMGVPLRDMESEDLLDYLDVCLDFIEDSRKEGSVLVHCFAGVSRSAAIITAYLMKSERLSVDDAIESLRQSCETVCPNDGFLEQLAMFEDMGFRVDHASPIYKSFRLKVLGDSYNRGEKIDGSKFGADPGLPAEIVTSNSEASTDKAPPPSSRAYRCKKCRRLVALQENVLDHVPGEGETSFEWHKRSSNSYSRDEEECSSIFVEPLRWMTTVEEGGLEGKLLCAHCEARLAESTLVLSELYSAQRRVSTRKPGFDVLWLFSQTMIFMLRATFCFGYSNATKSMPLFIGSFGGGGALPRTFLDDDDDDDLVGGDMFPIDVEEGGLEGKLLCAHCEARLGNFNWSGIQCSCGSWITPAFQLHKSRVDISTV